MKYVNLSPGSEDWHRWRQVGIGSSDAPAIMGVSPWVTPFQLWQFKTKRAERPPMNAAMRRGQMLEEPARRAYEEATGNVVRPHFVEHDVISWMRASLDGIVYDGALVVEIKCPGDEDHGTAVLGGVPEKYRPQVFHQLCVTGAERLHYWSWDGRRGALVEVLPDADYIARLLDAEGRFYRHLVEDVAPPLTAKDVEQRTDPEWASWADMFRRADAMSREAASLDKAAREGLTRLLGTQDRAQGGGVSVTRYHAKGSIDYAKVPQLQGVDLEPYRKAGRTQVRITVEEE